MAPKERRKEGLTSMLYTGISYKVDIKRSHLYGKKQTKKLITAKHRKL